MTDSSNIAALLSRPIDLRIREFKYRFAQATVFGLPAIALWGFGDRLSNTAESQRWVPIFSAILVGWIVFVAAAGMFSEGVVQVLLRRRFTWDFLIATLALLMYLFSTISAAGIFVRGAPFVRAPLFHLVALVLIAWCGARWWWLATRAPARSVRMET